MIAGGERFDVAALDMRMAEMEGSNSRGRSGATARSASFRSS